MRSVSFTRRALVPSLFALSLFAVGCGGGMGSHVAANQGSTSFVLTNASSETICFVNLSPTTDPNWGPDQLGPQETIQPGYQRTWTVPANTYDFRFQNCSQEVLMERRSVAVAGSGVEITFNARE